MEKIKLTVGKFTLDISIDEESVTVACVDEDSKDMGNHEFTSEGGSSDVTIGGTGEEENQENGSEVPVEEGLKGFNEYFGSKIEMV